MIFSWKLSYSDFVVKIDSNSEDIFRGENLISKSTHRNVANETYDFFFPYLFCTYLYLPAGLWFWRTLLKLTDTTKLLEEITSRS